MNRFGENKFDVKRFLQSTIVTSLLTIGLQGPIENIIFQGNDNFIVHAAVEAKSLLSGSYKDPNHPGCLRRIEVQGNDVTLTGSDNLDGSNTWVLKAREEEPGKILVDFSPKGGPKDLLGVFDKEANAIKVTITYIQFEFQYLSVIAMTKSVARRKPLEKDVN